ncbi:MAG: phospholipid carrier-dependent glycosyltransferase [Propioniciclava sp.]|uniref:dolichyl-phosphate-mannose--protein mannosyltransferase n=1 Tax=Propioniciclava sp. TaxID=2038686 RepID=UPI0039E24FE3
MREPRLLSWAVTLGIGLLAFLIRIIGVANPPSLMFDETYYAKDAWALLQQGYEGNWAESANAAIEAGDVSGLSETGSFIVHPPVGKWLIASGEALFGMNPFGWRIAAVVFGALLVVATIRLAHRLSRSLMIGALAGILLTFDGLAFTMSRIALLDIFQATFLVAAVAALVADRDHHRHTLADAMDAAGLRTLGGSFGPLLWRRPWRWSAGVLFGLAIATKWNSLYVLAVFGLLSVWWDVGARRLAGAGFLAWTSVLREGVLAFVSLVGTAAVVYVASWTSWLTTSGGWGRDWGAQHPDHPWVTTLGEGFASLLNYHREIYAFHTGDYIREQTHGYDAHPGGWLLMLRPTAFYANYDIQPGTKGCLGPETCVERVSALGTPLLWWMAAAALVVALIWWLAGRDWRFAVPALAALATYLPWFASTDRPLFFFYTITIIPFTTIALAMTMGLLLGPARAPGRRSGAIIVGVASGLVVANFAYLYPEFTGQVLTDAAWRARMWLATWV